MLNYHNQHENNAPDISQLKDSRTRMVALGFLTPLAILGVIAANLLTGWVVVPAERATRVVDYLPYGWVFVCVIAIKFGFAVALLGWYGLANLERVDHYALPTVLAAIVIISLGLLVWVVTALI